MRIPFLLPPGSGSPPQIRDGTRNGRGIVKSVVVGSTGDNERNRRVMERRGWQIVGLMMIRPPQVAR